MSASRFPVRREERYKSSGVLATIVVIFVPSQNMLLSGRSRLAKTGVFLVVWLAASSLAYDVEYEASHEENIEGSSRPDYSSYYKNDASAPLGGAAAGVGGFNDAEFGSFFNSPHFGFGESASTTKEVHQPITLTQQNKAAATGFVPALNFQTGFNTNGDPFSRDFFEQAAVKEQQKQALNEGESETRPGPSYISYRVPAPSEKLQTYASEVQDLNEDNDYDNFKKASAENFESYEDDKDNLDEEKEELNASLSGEEKPEKFKDYDYKFEPTKTQQEPLPTPFKPKYYTKYTEATNPTITPYQQFSFKPTADAFGTKLDYLQDFQSTAAPFNPTYSKVAAESAVSKQYESQPTQNVLKSTKSGKKCKKINKELSEKDIRHGRFRRQAMNCYVCEDPKNGANYEQCSYSTEPNTESYFVGKAERYSKPYRSKRDTKRQRHQEEDEEEKEYVNPYDYVKKKSHNYYSQPTEFKESYYKPKEYKSNDYSPSEYRFPKEYFDEDDGDDKEKSESEIQSEKLVKEGENCKKIKRKSMTCMVCTNPKTGGNYEQCSYSSTPAEKKYAYVRERKFDENENPIEDKVVESTEPKEVVQERRKRPNKKVQREEDESSDEPPRKKQYKRRPKSQSSKRSRQAERKRQEREEDAEETRQKEVEDDYKIPEHFEESTTKREKNGLTGLDPALFGSADSSEDKEQTNFQKEIDDYHFKHYPKHNEESESKQEERKVKPHRYEYEQDNTKEDVEAVLAEFAKKDRSKCKKAYRDGMTCYLCVDKNGMKNEECMFVSESQPKSSHIAYHEVKKVKDPEENEEVRDEEEDEAESQQKQVTRSSRREDNLKKRRPQQFTNPDNEEEASRTSSSRVKTTTVNPSSQSGKTRVPRRLGRNKNIAKDVVGEESVIVKRQVVPPKKKHSKKQQKSQKQEVEPLDQEIEQYALETSPVFSKVHGVTLPKYMSDISDYEKVFDTDNHPNH